MSNDQFYGAASRIDPVTVDGMSAGLAIKLKGAPSNTGPHSITTATIFDIGSPDGNGFRKITLNRKAISIPSFQNGAIAYVPAFVDNSIELPEAARCYMPTSSQCLSGSDRGQKIQAGHLCNLQGQSRKFLIDDPQAKSEPHSSSDANFQQGDGYAQNQVFDLDINNIRFDIPDRAENPRATIVFTPGSGDAFDGSSMIVFDAGPPITAVTMTDIGGSLPPSTSMSATLPEYWYNPATHQVTVSTSCGLYSDAIQANYYWNDVDYSDYITPVAVGGVTRANPYLVVEPDGATGYDAAGDDVMIAALRDDTESFVYPFAIYTDNFGDIPSGVVEYRIIEDDTDPDKNDPVFLIEFDNGGITAIRTRETKGGSLTSQSFTAFSFSGFSDFIVIQIERSGTTVDVYANLDGGSNTLVISHTYNVPTQNTTANIGNPSANNVKNGYIGVGGTGSNWIRFQHPTARIVNRNTAGNGILSVERSDSWTGVQYTKDVPLLVGVTVNDVQNLTTGSTMVLNNSVNQRDRYKDNVTADNFTFQSESNGTRIQINYDQTVSTGSGTVQGIVPSYPGTVDLATDGDNSPTKNKALYRDSILIYDPNSEFSGVDGNTIEITAATYFDPTAIIQVQYDVRGDNSTTWQSISASDYRIFPENMMLFISETLRAQFEAAGQEPCFRVLGSMITTNGRFRAEYFNGYDLCLDQFENGYATLGNPGSISFAVTAFTLAKFVVPRDFRCNVDTEELEVADWLVGYRRNQVNRYNQSVPHPAWLISGDFGSVEYYLEVFDDEGFSTFPSSNGNVLLSCGENGAGGEAQSGGYGTTTTPIWSGYASITPGTQFFFGSQVFQSGQNIVGGDALFTFSAIGFDLSGLMKMLDDGATILEAKVEANFTGLEGYSSTWNVTKAFDNGQSGGITGGSHSFSNNNGSASWNWDTNGNIINDVSSGSPTSGAFSSGGDLSFIFIGRRRNSASSTLYGVPNWQLGLPLNVSTHNPPLANDQVVVLGGGPTQPPVTFSSGARQIADITGPAIALMDARDSVYTEFAILPVSFDPSIITSLARIGSLGYAALPGSTASGDEFSQTWGGSSKAVRYTSVTLGPIYGRVRLPSGVVAPFFCNPMPPTKVAP